MKQDLKQRFDYLWRWELANGLIIFPVFYLVLALSNPLGVFSLATLAAVCVILIVGSGFWFLKRRDLERSADRYLRRPAVRRFFQVSKLAFGLMLLSLSAWWGIYLGRDGVLSRADWRLGSVLLLRHRRLKRAVMARELGI